MLIDVINAVIYQHGVVIVTLKLQYVTCLPVEKCTILLLWFTALALLIHVQKRGLKSSLVGFSSCSNEVITTRTFDLETYIYIYF